MSDRSLRHARPVGGPGPKPMLQWDEESRVAVTENPPRRSKSSAHIPDGNAEFKGRTESTCMLPHRQIARWPSINARGGILLPSTRIRRTAAGDIQNGLLAEALTTCKTSVGFVLCIDSDESDLRAESGALSTNISGKPPIHNETRDRTLGSCRAG